MAALRKKFSPHMPRKTLDAHINEKAAKSGLIYKNKTHL